MCYFTNLCNIPARQVLFRDTKIKQRFLVCSLTLWAVSKNNREVISLSVRHSSFPSYDNNHIPLPLMENQCPLKLFKGNNWSTFVGYYCFIGFHFSFHFHSFFSESYYRRAMLKTKTLERGCELFLVSGSWAEPRCSYGGGWRAWYSCLHPACQGKNPTEQP